MATNYIQMLQEIFPIDYKNVKSAPGYITSNYLDLRTLGYLEYLTQHSPDMLNLDAIKKLEEVWNNFISETNGFYQSCCGWYKLENIEEVNKLLRSIRNIKSDSEEHLRSDGLHP